MAVTGRSKASVALDPPLSPEAAGFAARRDVAHVVFRGTEELRAGVAKVKNMASGEEATIAMDAILSHLTQR